MNATWAQLPSAKLLTEPNNSSWIPVNHMTHFNLSRKIVNLKLKNFVPWAKENRSPFSRNTKPGSRKFSIEGATPKRSWLISAKPSNWYYCLPEPKTPQATRFELPHCHISTEIKEKVKWTRPNGRTFRNRGIKCPMPSCCPLGCAPRLERQSGIVHLHISPHPHTSLKKASWLYEAARLRWFTWNQGRDRCRQK